MAIKTIPLSRLKANLKATLDECADSGEAVVVKMPDRRLIAIQSLDSAADDSLIDDLVASNPAFRAMVSKSKASPRKPLTFKSGR
jgi:hypothetical protein